VTHTRDMLDTYPGSTALDAALVECMAACFACAQSRSACAEASLGEQEAEHMRSSITIGPK
jgi:hypothetical protein